ncbi:Uncharacterised protein [marine metagenome]
MSDWKYFTEDELKCSHSGKCLMDPGFMSTLEAIRIKCDFPFTITSAYRDPTHPIEAKKAKPGTHASGRAVDIAVRGDKALKLIEVAFEFGITGLGVQQKGGGRFIHLDNLSTEDGFARPNIWSY